MNEDKAALLRQLARVNPVELEKVLEVERQIAQLEQAGVARRTGFSVTPPLAHPTLPQRRQVLANADSQQPPPYLRTRCASAGEIMTTLLLERFSPTTVAWLVGALRLER